MIQEDYVSFEQAKAIRELGFYSGDVNNYYVIEDCYDDYINPTYYKMGDVIYDTDGLSRNKIIECPTLSLVQKWLREEKKIHVEVHYDISTNDYSYTMDRITKTSSISAEYKDRHKTYEETLSTGIDKAINILKNTL